MTDLLTQFKTQFETQSHHALDWLKAEQGIAFQHFLSLGLPTRKTENWKYTSIAPLNKMQFRGQAELQSPEQHMVTIKDGCLIPPETLPQGVELIDIFSALQADPSLFTQPDDKEAFALLNAALLEGGFLLRVNRDVVLEQPLEVNITHSSNTSSHHLHLIYLIEEGAKAGIIESYETEGDVTYFHNVRTDMVVREGASCEYFRLLNEANQAVHFSNTQISLYKQACLSSHAYSFGGALSRSTLAVDLKAEDANCTLNGLYVLGDNQHIANYTSQHHQTPHAYSDETYKGIIGGSGKAVFNGNIRVEKGAQKTNASLQNKNILLSKKASVDTKPQLEIFADDVKCAHGTTVGQLDDKALFYLRSRGIPLNEARELLVHAFAGDLLEKIDNHVLKTKLLNHLNDKLRKVA